MLHPLVAADGNVYRLTPHAEYEAADRAPCSVRGYVTDGFATGDPYVTVTVLWGSTTPGEDYQRGDITLVLSAYLWPSGSLVGLIQRTYRGSGGFKHAWDQLRRSVRDAAQIDIGERPEWRGRR